MTALTHESYAEFVRSHRLAVVHFWAVWNGYDAEMKTFLETEIPAAWRDIVAIGVLDTDRPEHQGLCRQLPIRNLPFLAFYRDGVLMATITGLRQQEVLERFRALVLHVAALFWNRSQCSRRTPLPKSTGPSANWPNASPARFPGGP
jgi:thioredoxin-like negative regulator of GroEL